MASASASSSSSTTVVGLDAPEALVAQTAADLKALDEVDYVVIGSGIGGLSAAALLSYYGYSVAVLESHYLPGGCAHSFIRDGFCFDAGPSLWNGMNTRPYNPLRQILNLVGEGDTVEYKQYDGWVMHVPEGSFKFTIGAGNFEPILERFGGPNAVAEWTELNRILEPVKTLAGAVPPLTLRSDPSVVLTLFPHLGKLVAGAGVAAKVEGPFKDLSRPIVKDKFLEVHVSCTSHISYPSRPTSMSNPPYNFPPQNWFEFLSFALSGLPADSTIAAAVAYTMNGRSSSSSASAPLLPAWRSHPPLLFY